MKNPFKVILLKANPELYLASFLYFDEQIKNILIKQIKANPHSNVWSDSIGLGDPCRYDWNGLYPCGDEGKEDYIKAFSEWAGKNAIYVVQSVDIKEINPDPNKHGSITRKKILFTLNRNDVLEK